MNNKVITTIFLPQTNFIFQPSILNGRRYMYVRRPATTQNIHERRIRFTNALISYIYKFILYKHKPRLHCVLFTFYLFVHFLLFSCLFLLFYCFSSIYIFHFRNHTIGVRFLLYLCMYMIIFLLL